SDVIRTEADHRTRRNYLSDPYRHRHERHTHRSEPSPEDQEARGPRTVRARRDRPPEPRGRPSRLGIHLRSDATAGPRHLFRIQPDVVVEDRDQESDSEICPVLEVRHTEEEPARHRGNEDAGQERYPLDGTDRAAF